VTDSHLNLPQLPLKLTSGAVIGLADPAQGDWARLRGLQYGQLASKNAACLFGNGIGVVLAIAIFFGKIPLVLLLGWAMAVAIAVGLVAKLHERLSNTDRRAMQRSEFIQHGFMCGLVAMLWGLAMVASSIFTAPVESLAIWAIVTMLALGSLVAMGAAPLTTIAFVSVAGLAGFGTYLWHAEYALAVLVLAFSCIAILGSVRIGFEHLTARIAEAGMIEKGEVVSLLLREFEENQADWLWQIDQARRVRTPSPRFAFALGREVPEVEGASFIQLIAGEAWESGNFPPSLRDLAERLKQRENFSSLIVEVWLPEGRRWWELSGTPMLDEKGNFTGYRGVGSDVTVRRESDEKIAKLARFDTLTGLPNRLMLTEALGDALRYADQWRTRCAFLMIDLDRFKAVNDSLGHQVGDKLLAQVAERLKSLMSDNELCGRLGGDEFAIVVRDGSESGHVAKVANSAIERLSQPYQVDNHTLYVGASVGSAFGPRDGATVETLMRNADLALYRAKDNGGSNHFAYEPSLHADAEERRRLELSLRNALGRDEFALAFQPVVDANDEHIVSFEALLRWNSKEHGFVSPVKFVPIAEDTRLIVPIGDWVLREACKEATNWPVHVKVAVNVSAEQLLDPTFATSVVGALSASGLPAHRLEIEVTESIFVRDQTIARSALEQIMALGCSVALDDFGTGYSSLGYLRTLRFSTIKIDRSFVQGAARHHAESLAIVRAVVAMADSLGMSTTAEGVEDAQEAKLIRELGCKKIQGYYFGRPMAAEDALKLFRQNRARYSDVA